MHEQLVTTLLPILVQRPEAEFNIFDVMRYGGHEKQLSDVFAWLLDAEGTHRLGDAFQRIFIHEVNCGLGESEPIPQGAYSVRQEVNTSESDKPEDIADLVLEADTTVLVVENYYTSDPHGHSFEGYRSFGARSGKRSVVVMLCQSVNLTLLTCGWENAAVVTYSSLLEQLIRHVEGDELYQRTRPQQCAFFSHMHNHFVKGQQMNDDGLIRFINAMCITGEAERFRPGTESAAVNFADMLRERAKEQFGESRELLQRGKATLKTYCLGVLKAQVNEALGDQRITDVSANYSGIYQWTINFLPVEPALEDNDTGDEGPGGSQPKDGGPGRLQLKFGPSAWFANETDEGHKYFPENVPPSEADYTRLFMTWNREIRQSAVSMQEILDGIAPDDFRLRDEIVSLMRESV